MILRRLAQEFFGIDTNSLRVKAYFFSNLVLVSVLVVMSILIWRQRRHDASDKAGELVQSGLLRLKNTIQVFDLATNQQGEEITRIALSDLPDSLATWGMAGGLSSETTMILQKKYSDYLVNNLKILFEKERFYKSGFPVLISKKGVYIIHPSDQGEDVSDRIFFQQIISSGKNAGHSVYKWPESRQGKSREQYFQYVDKLDAYLVVSFYTHELYSGSNGLRIRFVAVCLAILIVFNILLKIVFRRLFGTLDVLNVHLGAMALGQHPGRINYLAEDELGSIIKSTNALHDGLDKTSEFAIKIGSGELETAFTPLSNSDVLGNSLLDMRKRLLQSQKEEAERKKEDEKRSWANQGIAKFSEILRESHNVQKLCENIVVNLVDFLQANQGGVFVYNDENPQEPKLELMASYAYNRQKFLKKEILPGEGLVGAVALERKSVYLKNIPEDYAAITSGLGGSRPRCLLIVPLKNEENLLGVLEIASFEEIRDFEREFVEQLAQSIGSTLSSAKLNETTARLLEQSRLQSEALASQEEELRQNMEEMQATQEEMKRKQADLQNQQGFLNQLVDKIPVGIFMKNMDRKYVIVNQEFGKLFGRTSMKMLSKKDPDLFTDAQELNLVTSTDNQVIDSNKQVVIPEHKITLADGKTKTVKTIKVPFVNNANQKFILGVTYEKSDN